MNLLLLLLVVIVVAIGNVGAYHLGGNDTNCWKGPNYVDLHTDCDSVGEIHFTASPAADVPLYIDEPFTVIAELIPESSLLRKGGVLVPHANFHMCRADLGWCTPDVNVTQDLVTQSPPIVGDSLVLKATDLRISIPGQWSIVAHFTVVNEEGEWDVAAGFKRRFLKRKTAMKVDDWAVSLVVALACIGLACSVLTGLFVYMARNHWVLRASSPNLSLLVLFGCILAFSSVFTLIPPVLKFASPEDMNKPVPTTPSPQCNSRIWMLSLAFDFVLIPLALKTWRVSILFSGTFKRVSITDLTLTRFASVLLVVDVVYCLVWSLGFPLYVGMIPTVSNPESIYIVQCSGRGQIAFETVSIVLHGLPLIWLASIGRKVRSNFRKRGLPGSSSAASATDTAPTVTVLAESTERKLRQFNESESLSLTLASLACMSIFAIALQYTVTDSPTAQMLMVSSGVIWSAFFVLFVLFVPRVISFVKYEKDGITRRRQSNQTRSFSSTSAGGFLRRHLSRESSKQSTSNVMVVDALIVGIGSRANHSNSVSKVPSVTLMGLTKPQSPSSSTTTTKEVILVVQDAPKSSPTLVEPAEQVQTASSTPLSAPSTPPERVPSHIADLDLL